MELCSEGRSNVRLASHYIWTIHKKETSIYKMYFLNKAKSSI